MPMRPGGRPAEHKGMDASVIIPTLNEEALLSGLLGDLRHQTFGGEYEIVVAGAGSADRTRAIAYVHGARLVDKYLAVELHRVFRGDIRAEIVEYEFGGFAYAEPAVVAARLQEGRKLMDKLHQNHATLLANLGGRPSLANLPAEGVAAMKEQFESLRELVGAILTFRGR